MTPDAGPESATSAVAPGFAEFVAMMALTISLVALSIDLMLPSLPRIGADLTTPDPNDRQLVVAVFVLGLSLSPVPFGLAADAWGRKPAIAAGLGLFALGAAVAAAAQDFDALLAARLVQGLGAAAPRTLAVTIVRDRFEGREMARVMSFVMAVFVLVPALAPALGLGLERLAGWRAGFAALMATSALLLAWLSLRLPETLRPESRRPIRPSEALNGALRVLSNRFSMGHTLAIGLIFGAFLAYLGSAQQVLGEAYGLGDGFVYVFGALALSVGAAGQVNARLVRRLGMRPLARRALLGMTAASAILVAAGLFAPAPPWLFLSWATACFFCFGMASANLTALAMAPLGSIAGLGGALVNTASNLMATGIGVWIGGFYAGDGRPLALGFLVCGVGALTTMRWAEGGSPAAT